MRYVDVPKEVSFEQLRSNTCSFSASQYKTIILPNPNFRYVRDFLSRELTFDDLGNEVGSLHYIQRSPKYFVRTKALQSHSFIPEAVGEAITPVNPKAFVNQNLKEGDVIISKDSNIGEVVILDKDYPDWMLSGALYRLPIKEHKYYLLAFLKHDFFRQQLDYLVPKSATIRHAKTLFLDCKIPMPSNDAVLNYVEALTLAFIEKEKQIKKNHEIILTKIEDELTQNQKVSHFEYAYPSITDLKNIRRLDTCLYSNVFQKNNSLVKNYKNGSIDLISRGFDWARGTSLEMGLLKTRLDSDTPKPGFYELIIPTNISVYGTVDKTTFIGTQAKLKSIEKGDIIFGGEGFGKGRCMVVCEEVNNKVTNYHGIRIINKNKNLVESIFIRCFLTYWRSLKMIDYIGVGGSGGHCAPSYFHLIETPNFPEPKQKEIAILYHNPDAKYSKKINLENFQELDEIFNQSAGIIELDRASKRIKARLDEVIDQIIKDQPVEITFDFLSQ